MYHSHRTAHNNQAKQGVITTINRRVSLVVPAFSKPLHHGAQVLLEQIATGTTQKGAQVLAEQLATATIPS
jgi:hypothetical protein